MSNDGTPSLDAHGCIPPRTPCPYRSECEIARGGACNHRGAEHPVAFSCAVARGFAIVHRAESPAMWVNGRLLSDAECEAAKMAAHKPDCAWTAARRYLAARGLLSEGQ